MCGVSTVRKHLTHIYAKLGVTSRTQALIKARESGLV
jgi:DNA-binding CsgD family transcriptional regulator